MQPWFFTDRPTRAASSQRRAESLNEYDRQVLASGLRHRAKPIWRAS